MGRHPLAVRERHSSTSSMAPGDELMQTTGGETAPLDDLPYVIGRLSTQRCVTTVFCVNAKGAGGGSLLFLGPRSPSRALATSWRRVVPEPLARGRLRRQYCPDAPSSELEAQTS
ncbi:hypothetical protein B0T17DRAFT_503037 [Bombardia bombarda]|uniref:Uncharacterized protein n=1 Tax=Bombardia bombarda TaxID=252184 RepID=A0AA40CFL1_9PEZI|nr:hypothetical protein B0T17DRAFT_503037 [Bombardia bombarda]